MLFHHAAALLCLVWASAALNLDRLKVPPLANQQRNVLYFQPHDQEQPVKVNTIDEQNYVNLGNGSCAGNPKYFCLGNYTCCKGTGTQPFACCPYSEASCCPDGKHCCPKGSHCDMVHQRCYRVTPDETASDLDKWKTQPLVPMSQVYQKQKPAVTKVHKTLDSVVVCPGGQVECADGQTCCSDYSGSYKCCPYSNESVEVESVKCDDGSSCPDGNTCCKMAGGSYGCCPLPKAECCSDHVHCCPNGYTCDVSAGTCTKGSDIVAWLTKVAAKPAVEAVNCPDGSSCPDRSTCCQLASGQYGCCPLPNAECCSDHVHCCPNGYTCDVSAGTCSKGSDVVAWLTKVAAKQTKHKIEDAVVCPGGQSQCPDGNTCCMMRSGEYGCCPYPKAVCCSDLLHCCPNGYSCDVAEGTCRRRGHILKWESASLSKPMVKSTSCPDGSMCPSDATCCMTPDGSYGCCAMAEAVCCADLMHCCPRGGTCDNHTGTCNIHDHLLPWQTKGATKPDVESVTCPDGSSSCPNGATCCKLASGEYGCCPLPQAVCCSDHVHCCPNGYTCDVSAGTCTKGSDIVAWLTKVAAKPAVEAVNCPDGSSCPDRSTCCQLASGQYGCCPLPEAECCSDHVHCCPNGYTCDVSAGTCTKGSDVVAWLNKVAAKPAVESVTCPDGHSTCPDGATCCQMASGEYGCCPLPNAECCSDHVHCCPNGYTCDVSAGTCTKGSDIVAWLTKVAAKPAVEAVNCPDGSSCPDRSTCCQLASGQYGCCPLPNAECCSDHVHCCPNGYTCDVSAGTCTKGSDIVAWLTKLAAKPAVEAVNCPDGSSCPDRSTCCQLASGQYGCCPLPNAECCSDHVHCCPNGYTCDVSAGTCTKGSDIVNWLTKVAAKPAVEAVNCPDGSSCPDRSTCCQLASGQYGCCPLPSAECCSDHVHCCPNGYTCDVSAGTCTKGSDIVAWLTKVAAKPAVKAVSCPDGSSCPDRSTCCQLASGQYGCCPLPEAECCSDHVHCCPNGYTCDVSAGTCTKGSDIVAWLTKLAAKPAVEAVNCPDGSSCPDRSTCCQLASGQYGCCPLPNAECCSDHVHCCPNGYTCDVSAGTCTKGSDIVAWLTKVAAKPAVEAVSCPDGSSCPDRSTCCQLASGQYGCCPLPEAECCSDHVHCCPNGYTCDVSAGTCTKGSDVVAWLTKVAAKPAVEAVNCPDGSSCPDRSTCCQLASGQYGCCPLPSAECCSDHVHCCPNGYTCDVSAGTCTKGSDIVAWLTKVAAKPAVEAVNCPDGSSCPDRSTCCQLASGQYGCCPLPEAECCSDHVHCCPNGYTCDVSAGTCTKGSDMVNWLTKVAAKPAVEAVNCPDGSSCPDRSTCCQLASGQYGCCPLPEAECCSDHVHCCPNGYTCDVSAGTCTKGSDIVAWLTKVAAKPAVEAVSCPDGSSCPDRSTCCQLASGQYGCCPLPEAECCSDHVHCCPNGYTCDVSAGTCTKGSDIVAWLTKVAAKPAVEAVSCPDGSSCPDRSTCCQLASGQYGCCPLPEAECCSDHVHCCPNGYTCDVSAGTCTKGSDIVAWLTKVAAKPAVEAVSCPDGSSCPDRSTCCQLASGQYGCCPLPEAECCSDHVHCCPNGYTCDVSAGTCTKGSDIVAWLTKVAAKPAVEAVSCPDGSSCPDRSTCCQLASGQYGCCPLPEAECCSDHVHCCPNGYTCDVSAGTCTKGSDIVAWLTKVAAKPAVEAVNCPDGSSCPDRSTCCQLASGQYGCCPLPEAECCSDHVHCCPNGYTCDVSAGTCTKGSDVVAWLTKVAAKPAVEAVSCPDGSSCPDRSTCCQLASGQYGCCPLPEAECCSDHVHCCPNGYTCDVSAGTCTKGSDIVAWLTKVAAKPAVEAVSCPDGSSCPDRSTCCQLASGQYGCCPLPEAECCSDHVHCCPNGYTCDVSAGTCTKGSDVVAWLTKVAAKPAVEAVNCPDGSSCPDRSTCCQLASGQYGCCPLPEAECCSDHVHCCPNGYTCDVSAGTCTKGIDVVAWLTKVAAKPAVEAVSCPDGSSCPDRSTCCQLASGQYGCCPLPEAECCSDHVHCCPNGYTCDVSAGTCTKGSDIVAWLTKVAAKPAVEAVSCPDGSSCPDRSTCCQLASGQYGCCPLPNAECCSDHVHCCPNGYTCDVSAGTCTKGSDVVAWLNKVAAKPAVESVTCPDGHSTCPDGATCCQLASGEYGCCPLPDAECCSDHVHCCPNGYTCDVSAGTCTKGSNIVEWLTKVAAKPVFKQVKCSSASCP